MLFPLLRGGTGHPPTFPAEGISLLERLLVLPWPKQTCWWYIMINVLDHPNLASILVSPVQDHTFHKAIWVTLKAVRNCFTVFPHGTLYSDLIYLPDGMFLLAASLNSYIFHFPRAQVVTCTGTWLSSLCLFLVNLLPVLLKVSFSYLFIIFFFFCMKILCLQKN